MRLWRRPDHTNDRKRVSDPNTCVHQWRLRDVSLALPGPYVCEVCDRCGALRLDGPEAVTGPATHVADDAAIHLESLPPRSTPRQEEPPPPSD